MALERNAYRALESVVGPEYICEDPAILLGYAFAGLNTDPSDGRFLPFGPAAVVLPKDTEEVQSIVKICNRFNVKYKAHSTGYGSFAMPGIENALMVDLRRMDRIIDFDEKNRMMVIEPYVTAGQVQGEAMKRGLNCHVISAGGGHSPLASATSAFGVSLTGMATSQNARNLFGVEWVLPTGEVLRLGSPGSGAGWFTGDGPGPSLRGIMRGCIGAFGGLGIFTKIGYKLYPWYGPPEIKRTGEYPQVGYQVPENFKFCFLYWENWEDLIEAVYKITESEVAYIVNRMPADWAAWTLTKSNNEFYRLLQEEALPVQKKHTINLNTIIAARGESELAYKMKVLEAVLKETKGEFLSLTPEQENLLFGAALHNDYVIRGFRQAGCMGTSYGHFESIDLTKKVVDAGTKLMADYIKPGGKFVEFRLGSEGLWGWPSEGRYWWQENAFSYDHTNPEARQANMEHIFKSIDLVRQAKGGLGLFALVFGSIANEILGPNQSNCHQWMRKIKIAFDPQNASDHTGYIGPEPEKLPGFL